MVDAYKLAITIGLTIITLSIIAGVTLLLLQQIAETFKPCYNLTNTSQEYNYSWCTEFLTINSTQVAISRG